MESIRLSPKGLYTNPSALSAPAGALSAAVNVQIDRPGLVQSRRGMAKASGLNATNIARIWQYDSALVSLQGTALKYAQDYSAWVAMFGTYAEIDVATKPMAAVAKRNLYLSMAAGLYRISTRTGIPEPAGQVSAPGFRRANCSLLDGVTLTTGPNWLTDQYDVAYRYLIFKKDGYGDVLLGPVSGRFILSNVTGVTGWVAGQARAARLRCELPKEIQNSSSTSPFYYNTYFIQLFRSSQVATGDGPSDDLQQVYEIAITSTDVNNGYKDIDDYSPDSLRQADLYTNDRLGGIAGNNSRPPICRDICAWRNRLWGAGITGPFRFTLQLIAVLGNNGIQNGDTIKLDGVTYTGTTGAVGANQYLLEAGSGSAAVNIENTALNLVTAINKSASNTTLYATYASKPGDPLTVGRIVLERRTPGGSTFTPQIGNASKGDCWQPVLPTLAAPNAQVAATQQDLPNGLRWSREDQPDAWPEGNLKPVGSMDKRVLRLVPMRNRLWVFKEDGVFIVTGSSEADFNVQLWDQTIVTVGRDTVVPLENEIFLFTTQGVISVSESGRRVHSSPIDTTLLSLLTTQPGIAALSQDAFAIGYESDHKYILCLPITGDNPGIPQPASVIYVFQTRTGTWSQWTVPSAGAAYCGLIVDRALFLETDYPAIRDSLVFGNDSVYGERKTRTTADYQEWDGSGIARSVTYAVEASKDPSTQKQFGEVEALFTAEPATAVSITCSSETASGAADSVASKGNLVRRTWPQVEVSRCARLAVTVANSGAQDAFDLAGLKVGWRSYGGKVGR